MANLAGRPVLVVVGWSLDARKNCRESLQQLIFRRCNTCEVDFHFEKVELQLILKKPNCFVDLKKPNCS